MTVEQQREQFVASILTDKDRAVNEVFRQKNAGFVAWRRNPIKFFVFPVGEVLTENVLLHAPGEPAPTHGDAWTEEGMATEDHVIRAWCQSWPRWRWIEFRGPAAEWVRDLLSGAYASMLHAGDIVCIRPDSVGHGDHSALCRLIHD